MVGVSHPCSNRRSSAGWSETGWSETGFLCDGIRPQRYWGGGLQWHRTGVGFYWFGWECLLLFGMSPRATLDRMRIASCGSAPSSRPRTRNTYPHSSAPAGGRGSLILSLAQFRPEKDHALQLRAFSLLLGRWAALEGPKPPRPKLVVAGAVRHAADQARDAHYNACGPLLKQISPLSTLKVQFSDRVVGRFLLVQWIHTPKHLLRHGRPFLTASASSRRLSLLIASTSVSSPT